MHRIIVDRVSKGVLLPILRWIELDLRNNLFLFRLCDHGRLEIGVVTLRFLVHIAEFINLRPILLYSLNLRVLIVLSVRNRSISIFITENSLLLINHRLLLDDGLPPRKRGLKNI